MGLGDGQAVLYEPADVHLNCLVHLLFSPPHVFFPLRYIREDPVSMLKKFFPAFSITIRNR